MRTAKIQINLRIHIALSFMPEEMLDPWLPNRVPIKDSDETVPHLNLVKTLELIGHHNKGRVGQWVSGGVPDLSLRGCWFETKRFRIRIIL